MKKLLVIKHGALGDIIQAIDSFESLRRSWPKAHLTLLTTKPFAGLLAPARWFDEIVTDKRAGAWNIIETWRIRSLLHSGFDGVIDLQCSRRTSAYFRLIPGGLRWFGTAEGCSDPMPDFTGVNNRERMLRAVTMAGGREYTACLDWLRADKTSPDTGRQIPAPYCIFIAGSSPAKPSKRWPTAAYGEIAARCLAQNITPVLCGTADDRPANKIISAHHSDVIDLTGQTSLGQLAGLMAGAEFVLGNDTGPVFLAARTDTITCMLMGPDTDPDMSSPVGKRASFIKTDDLSSLSAERVWAHLGQQMAAE